MIDFSDFATVVLLTGRQHEHLAALCGVSLRTFKKYCAENNPPQSVRVLLTLLACGFVGGVDPVARDSWHDWRVNGEYLITPEGIAYTAAEVRALPYVRALAFCASDNVPQLVRDLERALDANHAPNVAQFINNLLLRLCLDDASTLSEAEPLF